MDIQKLIEEHGADIAQKLQIATTQVYSKLLWYVQLNGVVKLATHIMGTIIFGVVMYFTHKLCKKEDMYSGGEFILVYMVAGLISMLSIAASFELVNTIIQIVVPEYYIINSIVNKISQ